MVEKPALGIVGAGKVGTVLARLWYAAGYRIAAVHSRTAAHAEALAATVNAPVVQHPDEVVRAADLTLLTVPDDVIGLVAGQMSGGRVNGKGVVHTSGA